MAYYTLVQLDHDYEGNKGTYTYSPQFGDKVRSVVANELRDTYWQDYTRDIPRKDHGKYSVVFRIVKTKTMRKSEVDAAIAKLNETALENWLNSFA